MAPWAASCPGGRVLAAHGPAAESANSDASTPTTRNELGSTRRRTNLLEPRPCNHHRTTNSPSLRLQASGFLMNELLRTTSTSLLVSTHKALHTKKRALQLVHTLILFSEAPPPRTASLSAGTPLLGMPFSSRPIGPEDTPPLVKVTGGVAWSQGNHPPKTGPHLFRIGRAGRSSPTTGGRNGRENRAPGLFPVLARRETVSTRCSFTVGAV